MVTRIDNISDTLQRGIHTLLGSQRKGPHRLKNLLHGTPLKHPAHPAIVSVPIGALVVAATFDALWLSNRKRFGWATRASRAATFVGAAGAVGAIATGLADWSDTNGEPRRLGLLHGALNISAFGLFVTSAALRQRRREGDSVAAATLGFVGTGILGITGYIGGEIAYKYGVGVNHTAWEEPATDFVAVMPLADLPERTLTRGLANGIPIVLVREHYDTITVLDATCTHAGGPLDQGTLDGDAVVCPWHHSRFCLRDGQVLDGPATTAEPRYDVRIRNGAIEVKRTAEHALVR